MQHAMLAQQSLFAASAAAEVAITASAAVTFNMVDFIVNSSVVKEKLGAGFSQSGGVQICLYCVGKLMKLSDKA